MKKDIKNAGQAQAFVPVKEIRNGIIILKDGGYRGVLICSAINFGLKSENEQQAITIGFQNFLNTLDFSVQIVVNSRRMDVRPYLGFLENKLVDQKTELMRIQLREYIEFVHSFSEQTNIMTKSFYVVIPYASRVTAASATSFFSSVTGGSKNGAEDAEKEAAFEEDRAQMEQRFSLIVAGLANVGVRATPLGTEEVIELLYRSFNPGELENPIRLDA